MTATRALRWASLAIALLGALAAVLALVPGTASGKEATVEYRLNPGQSRFWDGEYIEQAQVPDPALCGIGGPCPEYKIRVVKDGAWRLRVALHSQLRNQDEVRFWPDFPSRASEMIFDVQILDKNGVELESCRGASSACSGSTGDGFGVYAVEVFVGGDGPKGVPKGVYTVRVIPESVSKMAFRMRAKLEAHAPPPPPDPKALVPPNLRIIPPLEFNFFDPTVHLGPGGGTPDPANSCMEDEIAEATREGFPPPTVCLRYSMGLENAGDGRWDLQGKWRCANPLDPRCDPENPDMFDAYQRLWRADGTAQEESEWIQQPAGEFRFDPEHAHNHYLDAWQFRLFRVKNDGSLEETGGPGRKLGVQTTNERMADWRRFWPACGVDSPPKSCQHDRDASAGGAAFELQVGWGDLYEWNRGGNYVDFPQVNRVPVPGLYVLRGTTDPNGLIIESDKTDNVSYALFRVFADGTVDLRERGYGTDPWDPEKEVLKVAP